ncbi:hypothetical protein NI389_00565 [Pseudoalteromonas xiamenensis]|uniref:hypothetical protein n=1 Tax=Pseudoalteromonas xiamenensis TaxID=882626 RepID=UPI0027E3C319|nr:hypothetical protein [Pseudoalteromonas xiamenensis]WMN59956.1 hypothetical protein NI389_00565 [Pseudoalteromonas xiamenensis]
MDTVKQQKENQRVVPTSEEPIGFRAHLYKEYLSSREALNIAFIETSKESEKHDARI